jgi:hypothetical protein
MPTTTNFGWTTPADTDLVKDGALAIRTLGNGIDTSLVDLKGGTTGQVLSKNTNADMDFSWITQNDADAIQNSIVDAKGDLIAATADNTPARLPVGSNGFVLTADSAETTGLKWAAASAGKIAQVVYSELTTTATTTSTSFTDLGLSASITPSSASNTILAIVSLPLSLTSGSQQGFVSLFDGSNNNLCNASSPGSRTPAFLTLDGDTTSAAFGLSPSSFTFRHSPATTSSFTYKIRWRVSAGTFAVNRYAGGDDNNAGYGRGTATITLMEISA